MVMKPLNSAKQFRSTVGRRWYKAIQVKPDLDVIAEIQALSAGRGKRRTIGCMAS